MALVEARDVTKSFRRRRRQPPHVAVDRVSLDLEPARTLAVVGESGAGKSTLGRLAVRLLEPDSGSLVVDGIELTTVTPEQLRQVRRKVQMIFQDPFNSLDPRYTIGQSVGEPLKLHLGMNRADRERRSVQLLGRVGLGTHHLHRYPSELSGGQLQRVAIARALAVEPALIVCDEPVAALDVSIRAQVLNLMLDLQATSGIAYLFITHDLSTVRVIAHDILVMRDGAAIESGPCTSVFDEPGDDYTRELLGASVSLRAALEISSPTGDPAPVST